MIAGADPQATRRARAAATVVFFVTGAVFASWGARIPAVQDDLGLSPGQLAIAILGIEGGAVAGLPLGGMLVTRLGSRTCLRLGFSAYPPAMVAVALAPSLAALAGALAVTAAANSVVDVAMNVQGVELERRCGRPVLSGLHAGHSFGVLAGGLVGTAAAALAGWALLGAGAAFVAPAVLGAAPSVAVLPPPVAIAAVTTVGYLGSFTGPPAVGAIAELTGLSAALGLLVAAGAVAAALSGRLAR